MPSLRVAVVGHVEWASFVRVPRMPRAGEIVHASGAWEVAGGGGAVVAVQLARLAGGAVLFTALGDDDLGQRAAEDLGGRGVRVVAAVRREAQRRVLVHVDGRGERTITVIGERMGPRRRDPLPWGELAGFDAVFFTAGDAGVLRAARAARVLGATPRALPTLATARVPLDVLVGSGRDAGERYRPGDLLPPPALTVWTEGGRGGRWRAGDGRRGRFAAAPLPGPVADAYGCGDSFAAGLTFGLAAGLETEAALELGARCGAACCTGRGPYEGRLGVRRPAGGRRSG